MSRLWVVVALGGVLAFIPRHFMRTLGTCAVTAAFAALPALVACSGGKPGSNNTQLDGGGRDTSPTVVYLSPTQHLTRASLALRGVRPSIADLQQVNADPTTLPSIVDGYLATPEFGATIMDIHNDVFLLRTEYALLVPSAQTMPAGTTYTQMAHIFQEPLQLIRDVVMTDQPYTNILSANYTMANAQSAAVWGLAYTPGGPEWQRATWPDDRPAVGILASSILYERWASTGFNYNRGRANMLSRSLLCHDFLKSDIQVDTTVDLSNPDAIAHAVVANPSCAACHQSLDPVASNFFVDVAKTLGPNYPVNTYSSKNINGWTNTNKRAPMYFGQTETDLADLAPLIATDPRFSQCAAINFASYMSEVGHDDLPDAWIARLQAAFEGASFSAKALAKAIVLSDEFRVAYDSDANRADTTVGYLKLRPEQMNRMLIDLTGFEWTTESPAKVGYDTVGHTNLFESDQIGLRALSGGIDSYFVTAPVYTMNATSSLSAKMAAASAAEFVIEHDAAAAAGSRTLMTVSPVTASDETSVRAELVFLHARLFGELVQANDPSIDQSWQLFSAALSAASGDSKRAWKVTLIGMLTDVRSLYY